MKKKVLFVLILLTIFMCIPNVMATDINNEGCRTLMPDAIIDVKIANTVHYIILAIQIVVPILLVIFGMLDFAKSIIAQKEDEIKKGQQIFIKRLLSAAIIFFVVAVVKFLIGFVADANSPNIIECMDCFLNGADKDNGICNSYS